jgi:hypothetical protein
MIVAFDARNELRDIVVLRDARRSNFLAFAVETADEAHPGEQVLRAIAGEVEDSVFLADLRRLHVPSLPEPPPPGGGMALNIPEAGKSSRKKALDPL